VLTLTAALGADVTELLSLPPGAFRPAPKVRSAVVRLSFRPAPSEVEDRQRVIAVARAVFQQRRKMLSNALATLANATHQDAAAVIEKAGLDPRQRPETLTLVDVARLAAQLER
jgi:16S rRNA (adenine1518-N6/adenine1519-N6)-dimethyltransferase